MTKTHEIIKVFSKQAITYERAAKVQYEIGERLFERLHYIKIAPKYILDLGCGTGVFTKKLARLYPKAHIVGLDLAHTMLQQAKRKHSFMRKWSLVRGDIKHLPFATGLFDLVFSNQVLHWTYPLAPILRELNRVMKPNACFMFSTLGPDTFKELKTAWSGADTHVHTNEFIDMHDVGDALMAEHFLEPVVDMETLSVHYPALPQLIHSLKEQGVKNINRQRNPGLTGKKAWHKFAENYAALVTDGGKYPLSYEVVYGHAWKGEQRKTDLGIETFIPVSAIKVVK
ncbi:MAG: malonyl-ACP O-methyltransferase BioC [Legionella sp.]|jgi:malonyl-CoA O-methyltransferase